MTRIIGKKRAGGKGGLPWPSPSTPPAAWAEARGGGYGLVVIRRLARSMRYERVGDRNRLTLVFEVRESRGFRPAIENFSGIVHHARPPGDMGSRRVSRHIQPEIGLMRMLVRVFA